MKKKHAKENDDDDAASKKDCFADQFVLEHLTSDVYGVDDPPLDWADLTLLVPHETIRRQLQCLQASVERLYQRVVHDEASCYQPWHATWLCEWYLDHFAPFVHEHHAAEEQVFFPWIASRAATMADDDDASAVVQHEQLLQSMQAMATVCETILAKDGQDCETEIAQWYEMVQQQFVPAMRAHLAHEERTFPPLVRAHFTEAQEAAMRHKIQRRTAVRHLRRVLPPVVHAMRDVMTETHYTAWLQDEIPAPLRHWMTYYYEPDYETEIRPKRDAPFYDDTPPVLSRRGCCGISCCFPCIL